MDRKRKVHSLIDKVYSKRNLELAWEKVKSRKGSGGIDGMTIEHFEERKGEQLERLHRLLKEDAYQPKAVRRVLIPKPDGGQRKLGIPTILDRVCQQALVNRMEGIFERKFLSCNFGYRPGKSPHNALRYVWKELNAGYCWIVDADLRDYFTSINQEKLVDLIAEEISDRRVLGLIRRMLQAGVMQGKNWEPSLTGVPQGGVASPLWSNIFLHPFDEAMTRRGHRLCRWADDFVILCRTKEEAQVVLEEARRFLKEKLGVELHPGKTQVVHVSWGFTFLGYKIRQGKGLKLPREKLTSRVNVRHLYAIPSDKSQKRFKEQIRNLTRRKAPLTLAEAIDQLNPVIRGWGNYYRKAHVKGLFHRLDNWIQHRLYSMRAKRWRNTMWRKYPSWRLYGEMGLVNLIGLVPSLQR